MVAVSRLAESCKQQRFLNAASQLISHLKTTEAKMLHNKTTFTYIQCDSLLSFLWKLSAVVVDNIFRIIISTSGRN